MAWPTSQDYNEVVQNAATCFADPDLKSGTVVVSAIGLPIPRSGNFADVYQVKAGDGRMWAVKCFTRKVAGLQERYARIDENLSSARLPFTVGFKYLADGIRVKGEWFPLLKMEWVEGFTLNEFVRDNIGKPHYLHALMRMWAKLTARLRDAGIAHADLQHGNVLLVPAATPNKLGLKLIDYDGMWVPALADKHSGEVGHPNYQHPLRLKERLFNSEVDRFPHLVIASALRATLIGGQALWDQFDNGDNLLFQDQDFLDPANAPIFKTLWELKDDVLCALLGRLVLASREPLAATPWLDGILLDKAGPRLTNEEEMSVIKLLGVKSHFAAQEVLELPPDREQREFNDFQFDDSDDVVRSIFLPRSTAKKDAPPAKKDLPPKEDKKSSSVGQLAVPKESTPNSPALPSSAEALPLDDRKRSKRPWLIGGGILAVAVLAGVIVMATGGSKEQPGQREVARKDSKEVPAKTDDSIEKKAAPKETPKEDPPKIDPPKIDPPKKEPEVAKDPPKKTPDVVIKDLPAIRPDVPIKMVWDLPSKSTVNSLAFSNDGKGLIASFRGSPNLVSYDAADGKILDTIKPASGNVELVAIAPDDKIVICDGVTKKAVCWDLKKKELRFPFAKVLSNAQACAVAGKINSIMLAGAKGEIDVFFLSDGSKAETHKLPVAQPIVSLSCSSDGNRIVAALESGEIFCKIPGQMDFKLVEKFEGAGRRFVSLSPDANYFAFAFDNQPIRVFETASGKLHKALNGRHTEITAARFSPDGQFVIATARDKTLWIWDLESGRPMKEVSLNGESVGLSISPDGRFAATAGNSIQVWRLPGHGARLAADEVAMLLAVETKKTKDPALVEKKNEAFVGASDALSEIITACVFSTDGKKIYATTRKGMLHILDATTLKDKSYPIAEAKIISMALLRKGASVAVASDRLYMLDETRQVRIFDTEKSTQLKQIPLDKALTDAVEARTHIAVSPEVLLISNKTGAEFVIRDLRKNQNVPPFYLEQAAVGPLAYSGFSSDGVIGFTSGTNNIHLWDRSRNFAEFGFALPAPMDWLICSREAAAVIGSDRTKLHAWKYDGSVMWSKEPHGANGLWAGAAIPKSPGLVTIGADNTLRVWNIKTGKQVDEWKIDKATGTIAVSPDGKFAAVALSTREITIWKLPSLLGKKP